MKRPAPIADIDATVMRRLDALEQLIDAEYQGKPSVFQEKTGIKMAQVGQWFTGYRALRDKALRRLEQNTEKPEGWFDSAAGRAAATITFTAAAIGSTAAPTVTSLDKRKEQRRSPAPGEVVDSLVSLLEKCDAAARDGLAGALPGLARNPSDPRAIAAVKAWLSPHEAARSKQANG